MTIPMMMAVIMACSMESACILITKCRRLEYQKAGARFPRAVAWVDLDIVPNPKTWLAERLGSLAYFKIGD
jgi:hypothetical protein